MKKLYTLLLCLLSVGYTKAETAESTDSLGGNFALNTVVVTGTRTPKLLKDTPIQTRLITSEEIRQTDATNIQDLLLQQLPGVEFSYAMSQQVNMNFSGFSGQSVLILIDGERLAGETLDNVDFSRINMANVERIEIIKGAASALYGSNAIGGVINIITKEAEKPWSLNLNARLADHREQRYGGSLGFKVGRFSNTFDVQHTRIDTYTLCLNTQDDCDFRSVYGGRTWNVKEKLVYQLLEALKFTAYAGYFFREKQHDVSVPDRYRGFNGGLRGEWDISTRDHLQLSYVFDQYDKSAYQVQKGLDVRNYSNVQHSLKALYNKQLRGNDVLTVGADFMRDYLASYQFEGSGYSQNTGDLFAQYDLALGERWEVIGAARWDCFDDFRKSQATAKIGFLFAPFRGKENLGNLTLRGGYSGGFRAPSLKERYMKQNIYGVFDVLGNPNLAPEKSHNFNLSAEYTKGHYNFTIASNYNIVADKLSNTQPIQDAENPSQKYVRYINLEKMRVFNLEATAQGRWNVGLRSTIGARIAYNYTREEATGSNINQYAPARPHSFLLKADWDKQWCGWYGFNVSLTGRILSAVNYPSVSMEPPFEEYRVHNPAYTLWKFQVENRLGEGVKVNVAVDNIFNYSPRTYYLNSPVTLGVNLMVGVSVDIDRLL